jgi:Tol biopolymer transport system component
MHNLWVMNADGGAPRQLSRDRKNTISSPAWITDGPSVVVRKSVWGAQGGVELWLYHGEGGSGVRLAERSRIAGPSGPAPSPDARYVYYSSGGFGGSQLYRFDRRIGTAAQLTAGSGPSFRPQVSPDGRLLAYARRTDARTELWIRDLTTSDERVLAPQVTRDASEGGGPDLLPGYAFTPDSRSIVIAAGGKIHQIDVATGADRVIPYRARVSVSVAEAPTTGPNGELRLVVRDAARRPVELGTYLGAYAHVTGFHRETGAMVHLHPLGPPEVTQAGSELTFHAEIPDPGDYRLFAQERVDGFLHTVPVELTVEPST